MRTGANRLLLFLRSWKGDVAFGAPETCPPVLIMPTRFWQPGNATIAIALISDGSAPPLIPTFCGIAAIGVGVALAHPQLSGAAVSLVPPDLAGLASAVTVVMRQAGFAVGIAVLGAVLHIQESAISYVWLFSAAAVDWSRRSSCCPHERLRQKSSGARNGTRPAAPRSVHRSG
jgi:hypothetical protein